jgi:hypothetical protein|tara:strand:- start:79 stop:399 length:321 start_codon:yes stop_codon:yes gene_type:complete
MAIQIFQKWLDDASRTFIASQFNAYRSLVQLPIEMTSDHSTVVMTNDTMLRQVFYQYLNLLKSQRATDLIRTALNATYLSDDVITGNYQTDILRQSTRIMPPIGRA